MIKINKSKTIPGTLEEHKATVDNRLKLIVQAKQELTSRDFERSIYGASDVKEQLIKDQYGKCAYCESKITITGYGVVDHFRPKTAWQQKIGESLEKPGYYWLAYCWENLLLACERCNTAKRNLFPLCDHTKRAKNNKEIAGEDPLLINPAFEYPEKHITFHAEKIIPLDEKGKTTVTVCRLDRPELEKDRREHYQSLKTLHEILLAIPPDEQIYGKVKEEIENSLLPDREYLGMIRCTQWI
jgi:uncharacterized protein (TIGR02646 family)